MEPDDKIIEPRIERLNEKKLVGKRRSMSFVHNSTKELWQEFMPERKKIGNTKGTELYCIEVYDPSFFDTFDPAKEFEKWAAVEVAGYDEIPHGMERIVFPAGLYAVFIHKGPASEGAKTYRYIFTSWLPRSDYELDQRPHFAVMGEKYKRDDPASEEEIWIPVKHR